jgi:hypothetical protein
MHGIHHSVNRICVPEPAFWLQVCESLIFRDNFHSPVSEIHSQVKITRRFLLFNTLGMARSLP